MSCHHVRIGRSHAIVNIADVYRYGGFVFEFHKHCGPSRLKKNGDPTKIKGEKFWKVFDKWFKLTDKQKEKTRA